FTVSAYRAVHDVVRAAGGTTAYGQRRQQAVAELGHTDGLSQAAGWWAEQLRDNATGPVATAVTELAVAPLPEDRPEALSDYARGVLQALLQMGLTRQIADLRGRLQRSEGDESAAAEIFGQLV